MIFKSLFLEFIFANSAAFSIAFIFSLCSRELDNYFAKLTPCFSLLIIVLILELSVSNSIYPPIKAFCADYRSGVFAACNLIRGFLGVMSFLAVCSLSYPMISMNFYDESFFSLLSTRIEVSMSIICLLSL